VKRRRPEQGAEKSRWEKKKLRKEKSLCTKGKMETALSSLEEDGNEFLF